LPLQLAHGPFPVAQTIDRILRPTGRRVTAARLMLRYALSGFTLMVGPVILLLIFSAVKPYALAYQRMQAGRSS
jgi:hypothetical protein